MVGLLVTWCFFLLSPNDPEFSRGDHRSSGMHVAAAPMPTGIDKWRWARNKVLRFDAASFHLSPYFTPLDTLATTVPVSMGINLPGILAGWLLGLVLGAGIGVSMHRPLGKIGLVMAIMLMLLPMPVVVQLGLSVARQHTWLPEGLVASTTLAVATVPAIAANLAIIMAKAVESPSARFAAAIGLPRLLRWRRILLPHAKAFWLTQLSLLMVSLVEGPVLIETAFGMKGLGDAATRAAIECDKPLVLTLVVLSSLLVTAGVTLFSGRDMGGYFDQAHP
jgi:ABC-type dipeptide/oligopeptide/nickel transport system permease component